MSQPYIGEIRLFAGTFAPVGWLPCEGQLLAISEYDSLFELVGTTYGGDGVNTFGLPDLRGRFPLHQGAGGGDTYTLAETVGVEEVTLSTAQLPPHRHVAAAAESATTASAAGAYLAGRTDVPFTTAAPGVALAPAQLGAAGGSQPHENRHPYVAVSFIISLFGVFPSQS